MRAAAIILPLFSLRSSADLGRGEIPQLAELGKWMAEIDHRVLQLLPLCELGPSETSPYSALSVFAIDPLYIALDDLPGISAADLSRARSRAQGRMALLRPEVYQIKMPLLGAAFEHFCRHGSVQERRGFDDFTARNRQWLDDYVLFRALKERFSWVSWEDWPPELAGREPQALARVGAEMAQTLAMYRYFQFLACRQWDDLSSMRKTLGLRIIGDLAFCPSRDSADVWANQELFLLERSVGAPPDDFNLKGQRWGLPMPNWPRMAADDFKWWRMRTRFAAGLFDLLRVDHVVGFYRTYSYGSDPDDLGCFFPEEEDEQCIQGENFVTMLKEEAGPDSLIAEDLGTVPPWVKTSLTAQGVPGLKVFRWERENWGEPDERFKPPASYPELAVAATGTHDTDTLVRWWRTTELEEREKLALALALPASVKLARPSLSLAMLDLILQTLYTSPARLVMAPLPDLLGQGARINLPGTVRENNWSYRMPVALDRLHSSSAMKARTAELRRLARLGGRA